MGESDDSVWAAAGWAGKESSTTAHEHLLQNPSGTSACVAGEEDEIGEGGYQSGATGYASSGEIQVDPMARPPWEDVWRWTARNPVLDEDGRWTEAYAKTISTAPGYCYLSLVEWDSREAFFTAMEDLELRSDGQNPQFLSVAAWLQLHSLRWSSGLFRLVVQPTVSSWYGPGKYTQLHVRHSDDGDEVGVLIGKARLGMRLGFDASSTSGQDTPASSVYGGSMTGLYTSSTSGTSTPKTEFAGDLGHEGGVSLGSAFRPDASQQAYFIELPAAWSDQKRHTMHKRAGYCYLALVKESAREKFHDAMRALDPPRDGSNPYLHAVASWLQVNNSELNSVKFKYSVGHRQIGANYPSSFRQAHVEVSTSGLSVKEVISQVATDVRLGAAAEVVTAMNDLNLSDAPSTMHVAAGGRKLELSLPVGFVVNQAAGTFAFQPRDHPSLEDIVEHFESVQLQSASFSIMVQGNAESSCRILVSSSKDPPTDSFSWIGSGHSMICAGSANGPVLSEFSLPQNHSFGREIKGIALGNPDPVFYFKFLSTLPAVCYARGHIKLVCSGYGTPTAVDIGPQPAVHSTPASGKQVAGR